MEQRYSLTNAFNSKTKFWLILRMRGETSKSGWDWEEKQVIRMIIRGEKSKLGWDWEENQVN